jgi:hypothetical protein
MFRLRAQPSEIRVSVANFVFGMLIGIFIVIGLAIAGLVVLDGFLSEAGALVPPLAKY